MVPQPVDTDKFISYVRSLSSALLGADDGDLDTSFGERYNLKESVTRVCSTFVQDPNPEVLFVMKDSKDNKNQALEGKDDNLPNDEDSSFSFRIDTKFSPSTETTGSLAVIKTGPVDISKHLDNQFQTITLPNSTQLKPTSEQDDESATPGQSSSNPYEVLHSILHFAIAPYFDAFCKPANADSDKSNDPQQDDSKLGGIPTTRKKIADLELSLLHLQQNVEIPELTLGIHPVIEKAVGDGSSPVSIDDVPQSLLNDTNFLNSLQSIVNNWIKSIQGITKISRDPHSGSATQEINFWLSMETELKHIEDQLQGPGVTLTLDVLKNAKRFHATVSFLSDTGIKEASEQVAKYNQLMRDFPLDELIAATSLNKIQQALIQVFNHLNKKLRVTPYPVWRALALVEAISADLDNTLRSILSSKRLMHLEFDSLESTLKQTTDIFATWDDCAKEFTNIAREVTRKRSEKFIPIRITPRQLRTKERLEYIQGFRKRHEELYRTLYKVLGSEGTIFGSGNENIIPSEFEGLNPLQEVEEAYTSLKDIDALDTTEDGVVNWNRAEKVYHEKTSRVEQAVIAMLRDRLATARTSSEMFRVFSKFNALFVRPAIRGAVQEYQTRLIDNVKMDIASLHEKFRQQYSNSEAHEMSKLRDLPSVSGTIVWIRQIEHQLDSYMQKVEDVLGKGWNMYAEGQKLYSESSTFRKKLDTRSIYDNWLTSVSKKKLAVNGYIFRITKTRSSSSLFDLVINFDPQAITLFKEVRNLHWLSFQVPHSIVSVSKDAKRIYPFAVSLIDIVKTLNQTLDSIKSQTEIELLLNGYENSVYQLLSKGMMLKWESFAHASDIKTGSSQSRHVRFVNDLDNAVTTLETRTNEVLELYSKIDNSLQSLKTCLFDEQTFSSYIESIQENVDKLNLESYSNISDFVESLNMKLKDVLTIRCQHIVEEWLASFESPERGKSLPYPVKVRTHELTLKNQIISLTPPIESSRFYWLDNFQKNISSVCKMSKIDANRFNVSVKGKGRRPAVSSASSSTFMDIPKELSSNLLEKVYDVMEFYLQRAKEYLEKWYQFQSLWDLEQNQVFEALGDDMQRWLQILNEIRRERATFDTTDVSKLFGLLNIDFKPVQSRINSKYDVWQNDIIQKFSKQLGSQMKTVCTELETSRRELEKKSLDSMSTELVVSAVTAIQRCKSNLSGWEKSVQLFRNGQTTLSRYRFHFPSNWVFIDQLDNELAALKEILGRKSKVIDEQIDGIRTRVEGEMKRLTEKINGLSGKWKDEKPISGGIDPKVALNTLSSFDSEATAISASADLLVKASEALDLEFNLPSELEEVREEIRDFNSVWGSLDSVWASLNDLKETPWVSVVPRKVRHQLEDFVQTTKDMPTRIRQYSAFEHIQNVLKNYIRANTLLSEMKSEAIRERHWESLFKSLVVNRRVFVSSMTLGDVWDLNLVANASKVQDVISVAQGEMALENFLRQVRETWTNYSLELVNYRNMCRLIKNWDDLFQKCSEHLNSLQAMHHSPYFKVFEEEARGWEDKLNRVHILFDTWIDAQRQWVYLEGVFNNNAEINSVLPVEASRFQNINSELFVILRKVYKSPLVLDVLNINGIQGSIERLADMLGKVQRALGEYFEKERQRFARFYFIGDEDLLEIIGNSTDIKRTERHLSKMFAGISGLVYDEENSTINGVRSKEGEILLLTNPISLVKIPKVVDWLMALEEEVRVTVSDSIKQSLETFESFISGDIEVSAKNFMLWIQKYPCQACLLSTQIYWTQSIESSLQGSNNDSLQDIKETTSSLLRFLADFVLKELSSLDRRKCESLVTELIHQRGVLTKLIENNTDSHNDFLWQSQMSFVFNKDASSLQRLLVRQANAEFSYGFEYLGAPEKLVRTPLIDKCFLTMTQALDQKLGGSPFGPAGTGKTEAVKALGQQLGKFVLVFNCDETFDFQSMGRILLGICQIGAWGCFDEFNRLDEKILSAVSSQIECIETGLRKSSNTVESEIELIGRKITINVETGIFITMNPGYAGRNSLPENLKKLFRSFSMARPDKEVIADVVLNSQGFVLATKLSHIIVPFFTDLDAQLSNQIHYDFGLRALKNVLTTCGSLKRAHLDGHETVEDSMESWEAGIILQSLRETIAPKLLPDDLVAMNSIVQTYFAGISYKSSDLEDLRSTITDLANSSGLTPSESWIEKCLQLYRFQEIHHGIMLVGFAGSGKSSVYLTLLKALEKLEGIEGIYHQIDAKVMSKEELYGVLDPTTREWNDGLFTSTLRRVVDNLRGEDQKRHWIVFDGDVDPEWVENLNSVLDDNKVLTLPNGERIPLPQNVRILFEVENLEYATPATVSRCGMIWFGENVMNPIMQLRYEVHCLKDIKFDDIDDDLSALVPNGLKSDDLQNEFSKLVGEIFDETSISSVNLSALIDKSKELKHVMEFSTAGGIGSFFSFVKAACFSLQTFVNQNPDFPPSAEQRNKYMKKKIILGLVWSFSGDCSLQERQEFGNYLMSLPCFVDGAPSAALSQSVIDFDVSLPEGEWSLWLDKVPKTDLTTHAISDTDVVVPTIDTTRHESLIYGLLHDHKPIILCGPPGSGKTMTLFGALRKSQNLDVVGLNFSKATTPDLLIKSIEQYCEYKKTVNGTFLSPNQIGRWLVVFCDEINLPAVDKYGTQRVISLLRQMVEKNGFWKEKEKQWVTLSNIQFVGACNPPEDVGRNAMNLRFMRHCTVVYVGYPGETSLSQIYGAYNNAILKFVPTLKGYSKELTDAMVEFYLKSQSHFTTEVRSHYIYSPRELTRWCRGVYECVKPLEDLSIEGLVRIWAHEAIRLFHDRLVDEEEKLWTHSLVRDIASKYFLNAELKSALKAPILYSNWLTKDYLPVGQEELKQYVNARVKTFCEEELDTPLILYDDLLDHVLRIDRVLRQAQGHLILIGISGIGKTTLSRFVAWMNGLKTFQLKTSRKYTQEDFDFDLRQVLRRAGCNGEKICFILDESNILESSFLERMNTLLANGEVPGLFEGDDYSTLMTACREGALRQGLNLDTEDELYKWFTSEIVRNLHVIFTMNPPDSDLASQATASPALFNRCVLNWMGDWSDETLYQIAQALTEKLNIDRSDFSLPESFTSVSPHLESPTTFRGSVVNNIVYAHKSVANLDESIQSYMQTKVKVTPGNFLDCVEHFVDIYKEKLEELEDQQRHFNVGLDKLKDTVVKVRDLRSTLAEKKSELEKKNQEARNMLKKMVTDQNEAERKREASIEIQHALEIQEKEISERQSVVYKDLERAEPAVREAQKSVSNIKKQHLTELRSMINPPEPVKLALESVCVLLGHKAGTWKEIQSYVRRDDFISSIVNFDSETQMDEQLRTKMERDYLSLSQYNFDAVNRASKACGPLLQWVVAQVDYSSILERVGPLRDEVVELEDKAKETKAQAQAISDMIEELEKSIERYKDEYAALITETQSIKGEMTTVEDKVNRSVKLVDSLSTEKSRWSASVKEFEKKQECLAGNCLISSAFISYAGSFDQQVRQHLRRTWELHLESSGIPFERYNSVSNYLATGKRKLEWHENSLPVDELCVENAVMSDRYIRYPLIIDPTARMIEFFQNQHKSRKLTVTSFLDAAFVKHLESALRFGNPILIQDAEHLDPVITQVLNKEYKKTGGRTLITLGRQDIDFSSDFQLYLLTRDPSVKIPPHISSRTTVINFTITRSSLESQALNQVLQVERPDVEAKRKELIKLQSEYQVHLRQLETNLLEALSEAEGSILDNDKVIETLESLKVEAEEVTTKYKETDDVMKTMEDIMDQYKPLANHCGMLFAVLEKLSLLNDYYQFSLEYFLNIFSVILNKERQSDKKESVLTNVNFLITSLYQETFKRSAPSLLKNDKALLVLMMIQMYIDGVDHELFGKAMSRAQSQEISIGSEAWLERSLSVFTGTLSLKENIDKNHLMEQLSVENPEVSNIDILNGDVKSKLQLNTTTREDANNNIDAVKSVFNLVLIEAVRPECFLSELDRVSKDIFNGESLLNQECDDLKRIVEDECDGSIPVALAVAPGCDPNFKVNQLLDHTRFSSERISMGSKEEENSADSAIQYAAQRGSWVILQNVHLSPGWLEGVEKRLKSIKSHENFRLIYTVALGANIPTTLLRMSRIMVIENPPGIKSSMQDTFGGVLPERVSREPKERGRLYYLLSWVHGVIQERLRFVPLGWSKSYDFNNSDFESGSFVIDKWVNSVSKGRSNVSPTTLPWEAIRRLIIDTIYGSKIDNKEDFDTVENIVMTVFQPESFNLDFSLVSGKDKVTVPEGSSVDEFMKWIDEMPDREPPTWLGLSADSDKEMLKIEGRQVASSAIKLIDNYY